MTRSISIVELQELNRAELLALWLDVFEQPAPRMLSQSFLKRFLAFESQSRRFGGLDERSVARLQTAPERVRKPSSPALKPGGRLLREWNGVTHVVDVLEEGFVWKERHLRSLSAIARAITGARWSGPRFVGLMGKSER